MKLQHKVFAVIFAFLAFTWLMPPQYVIGQFTNHTALAAPSGANDKAVAAAAQRANSSDANMMLDSYQLDSSDIVGEVIEKRDKYTKHFMMEDGTFQAVLYESAVHYQKGDGYWAEVDNTLIQSKDKAGNSILKTKDNGYMSVSFANDSKTNSLVSITKGQHTISWKVKNASGLVQGSTKESNKPKTVESTPALPEITSDMGASTSPEASDELNQEISSSTDDGLSTSSEINSVAPNVIDDYAGRKAALKGNALKRLDDRASSHIQYKGINNSVSLDYVVQAERIKESITLDSYIPNFSITFDIYTDGLTAKTLDGGIVAFCDGDKEICYLMPSFAFDSADNEGIVHSILEPINGGYSLTLSLDDAWLSSAIYPVVIDPQFQYDWNASNINDTYISSKYHNGVDNNGNNGPWYTYASLRIGFSASYDTSYALVKYVNLPALKSSEAVIGAYMISEREDENGGNYQFTIHNIVKNWSQTQVTWDNFIGSSPSSAFDSTIQESHMIGDSYGPYGYFYTWDITNLMRGWYTGDITNYGLLIKGVTTSTGYRRLYAANATYVSDQVQTIIQYMNTAGLEGSWSYQSMDARRAGTASVNLFTGNLVASRSDIGTSGNRMPVSISHVYNAVYKDDTNLGYGMGWRVNYAQTIAGEVISGVQYYKYTDEDGTIHYFKQSGSTYMDESGQNRTLEFNKSITDINNNTVTYGYTITDKDDNVLCFDSSGRLAKIKDCVGNYIAIAYSSGNKISSLADGANRTYTFSYNASGDLASIAAPGNRTVSFTYDGSHRLIHITDPDNYQSTYAYNTAAGKMNNALTEMRNYDNYYLSIAYNSQDFMYPKVQSVTEHANTTLGGSQTFNYYEKETKVTDHLGNINIYQFNQYGNAVTIQDDKGRAVYCQYYNPTASTPSGGTYGQNKMSLSSRLQEPVMNYAMDSSFENGTNYWAPGVNAGGSVTRDTTEKKFGAYSVRIENTSTSSNNYYIQSTNVAKGKTYTFSAWVKTSNIVSGSWGAHLQVKCKDANGEWLLFNSQKLSGTNDWTRLDLEFTLPADSTSNTIYVTVVNAYCTGVSYFDGAQLEQSDVVNRYNLVQNGDMTVSTSGVPNFWTKNADCSSTEVAATTSDPDRGLLDNNVFKIVGDATKSRQLIQTIMVSGAAGDSFSFGGWGKASSAPLATPYPKGGTYSRRFAIHVDIMNGSTGVGSVEAIFNDFSNMWQYLSGRIVASGSYDRVVISLVYAKNCNTAWFDGIQLYKEEFGQCYDYDAKGNLITAKDLSSNSNSVTYDANNNPTSLKPPDCSDTQKYTATYLTGNQKHLVDTAATPEGVKSKYTYDAYGNTLTAETRDNLASPTAFIRSQAQYTANGNYISRSYDPRGYYSQYGYSDNFGVNLSTTDLAGQTVNYTYDGNNSAIKMGKLTNVSATVGGTAYSNSYGYTNDLLTTITHNGFNYTIGYNAFGQTSTVAVAGQNVVTNTYITGDRSYLLDYLTYGNGGKVDYTYDDRYRVSAIAYDNEATPRYKYTYAANGQLGSVTDNQNGLTTNLYYDLADRPMKTVEKYSGLTRTFQYTYDIDNCLTRFEELVGTARYVTDLTYDKDNRITKVNYGNAAGSENVRYSYDVLGRLGTRTLETGTNDYVMTYNYLAGGYGANSRTSMISSISYNGSSSLAYTYDTCGRIKSISNGTQIIYYTYDGLGQLLRTDDPTDTRGGTNGSTWTFAYDAGGNITLKKLYAYAYGDNDLSDNTVVHNYPYTYDATWKDKLTNFDGQTITYDAIGNPLTYNGWTYTWEAGRQLKQMSNGGTTLQFKYNNNGFLTQKTNGSVITKYYWAGSNITYIVKGNDILHLWYDAFGLPTMITYNGTNYYYKQNLQGDIIGIIDMSGNTVVSYSYDSWGKQLSCTGSLSSTLGFINPYRYKSYIYDEDTGLYYLQSRFYNPDWGRFINADTYTSVSGVGGILNYNLFLYCHNCPVNLKDLNGQFSFGALLNGIVAVAIGVAAVTAVVATCGAAAPLLFPAAAAITAIAGTTCIVTGCADIAEGLTDVNPITDVIGVPRDAYYFVQGGCEIVAGVGAAGLGLIAQQNAINQRNTREYSNPLNNIKYTDKVLKDATRGDNHGFPEHVDAFGSIGRQSEIIGRDGVTRMKVEIPGSYKGVAGNFEYIIDPTNNTCNHRYFQRGGPREVN
jgi:RHS repeat-associated protein